jgi:hypothetical protein
MVFTQASSWHLYPRFLVLKERGKHHNTFTLFQLKVTVNLSLLTTTFQLLPTIPSLHLMVR